MQNNLKNFTLIGGLALFCGLLHGFIGGLQMPEDAKTSVPSSILDNLKQRKNVQNEQQAIEQAPIISEPHMVANASANASKQASSDATGDQEQKNANADSESDSDFTVELLYDFWSTESAIFLDARTKEEFSEGHIPRSFHLPLEAFGSATPDILQVFPADQTFIVYCGGGDCHASHAVGALMIDLGFTNTLVYEGGYSAWPEAGHPVETGYFQ